MQVTCVARNRAAFRGQFCRCGGTRLVRWPKRTGSGRRSVRDRRAREVPGADHERRQDRQERHSFMRSAAASAPPRSLAFGPSLSGVSHPAPTANAPTPMPPANPAAPTWRGTARTHDDDLSFGDHVIWWRGDPLVERHRLSAACRHDYARGSPTQSSGQHAATIDSAHRLVPPRRVDGYGIGTSD